MRGYYFGAAKRNQPVRLDPMNPQNEQRVPAPSGPNNAGHDGFTRLSDADPRTGIRQPIGGEPVYPPYHEDS